MRIDRSTYLAFLFVGATLFGMLGFSQVFQVSEGREGVVVNEILSSGEWVLPLRNGEIVPSKPILFHWISASVAGDHIEESLLRFPSVIGALLMLFFLARLVSVFGTPREVTAAVLVLFSTYGFYRLSLDGRVDMLFSAFCVGAISEWIRSAATAHERGGIEKIPGGVYWRISIICGLAVLAKGPLGVVLPGLVMTSIAATVSTPGNRIRSILSLMRYQWIMAILIPLPWYVAASTVGSGDFVGRQLVFENIARFFGGEGITKKSPLFYVNHLFTQAMPWFLLPLLAALLHRSRRVAPLEGIRKFVYTSSLVWFLSGLILFTLSSGKRRGYLLPLLPAVAILVVLELFREGGWLSKHFVSLKLSRFAVGCVSIVAAICGAMVVYATIYPPLDPSTSAEKFIWALPQAVHRGFPFFHFLTIVMVAGSIHYFVRGYRCQDRWSFFLGSVLFIQFALVSILGTVQGVRGITHTFKDFAAEVRVAVPGERISFVKKRRDESFDGFFFYYRKHVRLVEPDTTVLTNGLYLARREWIESRSDLVDRTKEEILSGGRVTDPANKKLVLFRLGGGEVDQTLKSMASTSCSETTAACSLGSEETPGPVVPYREDDADD